MVNELGVVNLSVLFYLLFSGLNVARHLNALVLGKHRSQNVVSVWYVTSIVLLQR